MDRLRKEASAHPDPWFVDYVLMGIQEGFRVVLQSSVCFFEISSAEHAVGQSSAISNWRLPPDCVIPKKNQPNKWRLILDLSHPEVNDGVPKDAFSVQYMKVDDIIAAFMPFGRGALLAKFDMESAYRIVLVHPDDRYLLAMQWRGKYFVDMALPFGLRSAPYIFSSVAEWIVKKNYDIGLLLH